MVYQEAHSKYTWAAAPPGRPRREAGAGRTGPTAAAEPGTTRRGAEAFHRGIEALAQYQEREGCGLPARSHVEVLPDGSEHRTGVWIVNQKQRRDRTPA